MDENSKKEEFSYAYVKMIAALAGYETIVSGRPSDNSGIDIIIRAPGMIKGLFSPSIDAQVKCVSTARIGDSHITYSLPVKNYRRLILESQALQILILVLVPKIFSSDFLRITLDETKFKSPIYWINLKGHPDTLNDDNVTIYIPKENLLIPNSLKSLMEKQAEDYIRLLSLDDIL